jgi:hypothetical protein
MRTKGINEKRIEGSIEINQKINKKETKIDK